ncbi:unnamed protein product [Didymodactylos carnosus]|uniref:Uncharacterized protein n=1 Tax=Didymodactylos carnosus TaxID=1234261 RepID=A0A814KEQ5_9BILA|nr:unnamed protein product [Didymodactylos carnosus]CAF3819999.1 unnamed protein product [Didymodactylos carnosus]
MSQEHLRIPPDILATWDKSGQSMLKAAGTVLDDLNENEDCSNHKDLNLMQQNDENDTDEYYRFISAPCYLPEWRT